MRGNDGAVVDVTAAQTIGNVDGQCVPAIGEPRIPLVVERLRYGLGYSEHVETSLSN